MDMKTDRIPRVLVAKIGLDGHNRGAQVVAYGLRDAGMEVVYTGIRQTPAAVARSAVEEAVDVIGISSMVGAHIAIMKKLRKELDALNASDIPVILGGIIPEEDYDPLRALGVGAIFPPGAEVREMAKYIQEIVQSDAWVPEVPGTLAGRRLEELRLVGSWCEGCNRVFFPERRNCPFCLGGRPPQRVSLSDEGTLQTFVVASMAPPGYTVPHVQGYIDLLDQGPRIFSLLTDYGDGSSLRIGCRMGLKVVRLRKDEANRVVVGYRFRPLQTP